jgi:hypothetical protein
LNSSRKKWLIASAFLTLLLLVTGLLVLTPPAKPLVQITLVSPPTAEASQYAFCTYDSETAEYYWFTQSCYRAELRLKNLGPGSIIFQGRGIVSLEIQKTNSTEWLDANQSSFSIALPPIQSGSGLPFPIRIPSDAVKWRVTASYERWQLPARLLNHITRDYLNLNIPTGDQSSYDAVSEAWELNHPGLR